MPPALPPFDPSAEIIIASHGMSKGLGQTDGPQHFATARVRRGAVTAFIRAKNLTSNGASGEWIVGATWGRKMGRIDAEFTAFAKGLIGAPAGVDRVAVEFDASLARRWGRFRPRLRVAMSPDDLGGTHASLFTRVELAYALDAKWSVSGQIGRRDRQGGADYAMGDIGLSYTPHPAVMIDARVHGTSRPSLGAPYRTRAVGALRLTF